jgi:hypothetical protein
MISPYLGWLRFLIAFLLLVPSGIGVAGAPNAEPDQLRAEA